MMTLVIMAAGMGSRYGGLKQIDPVGKHGEFIIDYSIYDAKMAGFNKVVFIIKKENYDIFKETIGKRIEDKIQVEYAFQDVNDVPPFVKIPENRVKPWGTVHAILACKDIVKEPFVVINADDFYGRNPFICMKTFLETSKEGEYAMPGYILKNTISLNGSVARGCCEVVDGYLKTVTEHKQIQKNGNEIQYFEDDKWTTLDENTIVSMNMFAFMPDIFDKFENCFNDFMKESDLEKSECLLSNELGNLLNKGLCSIKVINTDAVWFGVTYKEDKQDFVAAINELIEKGVYKENLWS